MFAPLDGRNLPDRVHFPHDCVLASLDTRAEARELRGRARAAREHARQLRLERLTTRASIDDAIARAAALLEARRATLPRGRPAFPPDRPRRVSGRVTRRRDRRIAAATETSPRDAQAPAESENRWASALVFATRTVACTSIGADASESWANGAWTVREIDAAAVPGSLAPRCLVFENHLAVRRVWRYPGDWFTLPDAALLRLAGLP